MRHKLNKAIPFKIQKSQDHAILVQVDKEAYFYDKLHYHPEIQITAIVRGEGIFYAGNSMTTFSEMEVFIIGADIPHLLKNHRAYYDEKSPGVEGISLFFDKFSFGKKFFDLKELAEIKTLLLTSNRVIKITGASKEAIYQKIIATTSKNSDDLIIAFLQILSLIKKAEKEYLNNEQYQLTLDEADGSRLNEVLNYTFKHFKENITIEQVIHIAHLSRSQFSKFFKLHTRKTYIQFLNELRIENACVLLTNTAYTIEQICYETGFKNVSNFVRQFKKIKNTTPSDFRKTMSI
ncbi:MAG: AraC family transcriptional regulator [Saprospiraceae bacterium]|nr:MAG: AraC family transcriptional regulator [Saprospiraceae bacterium]